MGKRIRPSHVYRIYNNRIVKVFIQSYHRIDWHEKGCFNIWNSFSRIDFYGWSTIGQAAKVLVENNLHAIERLERELEKYIPLLGVEDADEDGIVELNKFIEVE